MAEANKAKTARRVIEVLEYFDEEHRHATVMDIVRRYKRPQSSTSELLASLVEMGILYKDAASRSYTLTPRAAILGSLAQPEPIRDGRLTTLVDQLRAQTGLGTGLFGMIGLNVQLFRWTPGVKRDDRLKGGQLDVLTSSAAGWLLLSTVPPQRREGLLRRLNAEAPEHARFAHSAMAAKIEECAGRGYAIGPAGFGTAAMTCAILLPSEVGERPLVLAIVFDRTDRVDTDLLAALLQNSAERLLRPHHNDSEVLQLVPDAA